MSPHESDEKPPPYQKTKRCIGYFECPICKRKWWSGDSCPNGTQSCWKCGAAVYPKHQRPFRKRKNEPAPKPNVVYVIPDRSDTSCFTCQIL